MRTLPWLWRAALGDERVWHTKQTCSNRVEPLRQVEVRPNLSFPFFIFEVGELRGDGGKTQEEPVMCRVNISNLGRVRAQQYFLYFPNSPSGQGACMTSNGPPGVRSLLHQAFAHVVPLTSHFSPMAEDTYCLSFFLSNGISNFSEAFPEYGATSSNLSCNISAQ